MNLGDWILGIALGASAVVAAVVFAANRRRATNQAFVVLALTVSAWLGSVLGAFHSHLAGQADFWIRAATVTGGFLPVAMTMLRISLVNGELSLPEVVGRMFGWVAVYALIAAYSFSSLYLVGAEIPAHGVPNARYGSLSWVFPIYLLAGLLCALVLLLRDHRKAQGLVAVELEYVLMGMGCIIMAGILAAVVPLITKNSQIVPFAPLCFVAMNLVIAYGIATRRILSVGTFLRRALSYVLLVVYLGGIYVAVGWGVSAVMGMFSLDAKYVTPLAGTLCVAVSVGGARSFLQAFVRKLFINLHQLDLRSTLTSADRLLTQVTTTEELLKSFLPLLGRATGTDLVMVCLFDELSPKQVWFTREAGAGVDDWKAFEVFRGLEAPLAVSTISRVESGSVEKEMASRLRAISGALAVPIRNGRSNIGVVALGEKLSGRLYDREEQESIQLLANRLAVALINARLYTEQRRSREDLQSLLDELPGGVIACDPRGIVTVCNAEVERLLGVERGAVLGKSVKDLPRAFAAEFEKVFAEGTGSRDQTDTLEVGKSTVPIRFSSQVFADSSQGAILVFSDLTQIKQLENEMLDIIGREQRSFGQDLHDSLCQELVGIQFKMSAFSGKLNDERQKAEAKQISDYMREALNHARMLAKGLAPVHVETNGLVAALDELASNVSTLFNFNCRFECPNDVEEPDGVVSTHLYRIAQEAISNAIRHGGGTRVVVKLDQVDGEGVLSINDDGTGFFPDASNRNGMGLHTMAYRAEAIGAKMDIKSEPGAATTVTCRFPVLAE